MNDHSIDQIWLRIKKQAGKEFHTKRGDLFTYSVVGDVLVTSRIDYNLSKSNFQKALLLVPFDGPGVINQLVRGPAYVWAILHDSRVRLDDW